MLSAVSLSRFHLANTLILVTTTGPESIGPAYYARLRHMAWFYTPPFVMPGVTLALLTYGRRQPMRRVAVAVERAIG